MDLPNKPLSAGAIATLKQLTGNDRVAMEVKYKNVETLKCRCKFIFGTNQALKMKAIDTAFTDRIICIPFQNEIMKECQDSRPFAKTQKRAWICGEKSDL